LKYYRYWVDADAEGDDSELKLVGICLAGQ